MDYPVSEAFHEKYKELYEHIVLVTLTDGSVIEGGWYDEFYEDSSILICAFDSDVKIIKISDIQAMALSDKD